MVVDFSTKNFEVVGLEIINLKGQTKCKNLVVKEYKGVLDQINWEITYNEYDMFYVGFRRGQTAQISSYSTKGAIIVDDEMNLAKIEVELQELR